MRTITLQTGDTNATNLSVRDRSLTITLDLTSQQGVIHNLNSAVQLIGMDRATVYTLIRMQQEMLADESLWSEGKWTGKIWSKQCIVDDHEPCPQPTSFAQKKNTRGTVTTSSTLRKLL